MIIIFFIIIPIVIFSVLMGMLICADWMFDDWDAPSVIAIMGYALLILWLAYTAYRL